MANQGKVDRVLREAVAVLVEELGPADAAERLEAVVAELRSVSVQPKRASVQGADPKRRRRVGHRPG